MTLVITFVIDSLFETRVCTAISDTRSESSESVHPIKSFKRRRYLGHRCTIVSNQSLSFNFPHLGSVSCFATKAENAAFEVKSPVREATDVWKDVTNGVYKDR